MSTKLVVVPFKTGRSSKELASVLSTKLGYKVWRVTQARVSNRIPFVMHGGTDKLTQLTKFKENNVSCPEFTTDRTTAISWLPDSSVVCRRLLLSSEGKGITIADSPDGVVQAPLYTRYIKKKSEFRVHILYNEVIDVQQKRKRSGVNDNRDTKIRNLANGYVFCRDNLEEPLGLRELGLAAVRSLGYTLGAVDIVYNAHHNSLYVLEVNACPGMQGTTLERYADKIIQWYKEKK